MQVSHMLDCHGLSAAPIVLRIKQALVGQADDDVQIRVLVGSDCDLKRIADSLGALADRIQLMPRAKKFQPQ